MHTWTVPGYANVRELGRSGSGWAVLATHGAAGVSVVIKYLADELHTDGEYLAGYRADARLLADVESPHIAAMYEYVESGVGAATVREYVAGCSVRQLMPPAGLRPESALSVLKGGLLGLAAAHARGLTHRGYHPQNLLVDRYGHVKLADFGVRARPTSPESEPEPDAAAPHSAPAEDVSAAFTTFLECVTGSRVAAGETAAALGRIPARLRGLAQPGVAGDGTALLIDLDAAARAACGGDWEARGRRDLARRVNRLRRRRGA